MEFYKKRNIGEVIGETFSFYRENFKSILKFGTPYLLIALAGWLITLIGLKGIIELIIKSFQSGNTPSFPDFSSLLFAFLGLMILSIALYLFQIGQTAFIKLKSEGEEITRKAISKEIKYGFWRIFGGTILLSFVIGIALLIIMLVVGGLVAGISMIGDGAAGILGVLLNLVIQIGLPAVVAPPFIFFQLIILIEKKGTIDSIKRAFEIHFKKFWNNFLTYLLLSFIQGILAGAFILVFYVVLLITIFIDFNPNDPDFFLDKIPAFFTIGAIGFPLIFGISTLAYLIVLFGMAFQYFNIVDNDKGISELEELKDAFDLPQKNQTDSNSLNEDKSEDKV